MDLYGRSQQVMMQILGGLDNANIINATSIVNQCGGDCQCNQLASIIIAEYPSVG